jgi:hypothetical protein
VESSKVFDKKDLLEICDSWQGRLKVRANRVQIRKTKNKWSSCSSKGNLTLSSDLMGLPKEVAEYVIVHELLHLIVPNHGKTFKVLLSAYLPNWEELHHQLETSLPLNTSQVESSFTLSHEHVKD